MTKQQISDAIEGIELLLASITQQLKDIRREIDDEWREGYRVGWEEGIAEFKKETAEY